jgi:hypothetical protein
MIARGWQYAEAIRFFQNRFNRMPNRLEELVEQEPRSIRQLWDDPLTGGPFLVLVEGPGDTHMAIDPETGVVVSGAPAAPGEAGEGPAAAPSPSGTGAVIAGPIHGVKSRATGESYRSLFDSTSYQDWEFSVERLIAATTAAGPEGILRRANYETIGKPFRYAPPGGVPGANPNATPAPGGMPGAPPTDELPDGEEFEEPVDEEPAGEEPPDDGQDDG